MQVVILGGGVAGLTAAAALHASGRCFRLYERRTAGTGGMGFILSPRVRADLAQAGVALPVASAGVPLRRFRHYRPDGSLRQVHELPPGWRAMRRRDLVRLIASELPRQAVRPGAEVAKLAFHADGMVAELSLATGEAVQADLYLAADGVGSLARQSLFPGWPQQPARVWEIVAMARHPGVRDWAGEDFCKFTGDGVASGCVPVGDQTVVWFIQFDRERFPLPETPDAPVGALARMLVGGWADPVGELLRATDFDRVHVWRPLDSDLLPRFHFGNLALVGDAAHPLLPFTSQGVAAAIAGARDLVLALGQHQTLSGALRAYSASCRRRCAPYIRQGRELTRQFLCAAGDGPPSVPLAT